MKILQSKIFYFLLGLLLAIAIPSAYAAWNDTVNDGDPLTATKWNNLVDQVENQRGEADLNQDNCQWVGGDRCNDCRLDWICPEGYYAAGIGQASTGENHVDYNYVYCCEVN